MSTCGLFAVAELAVAELVGATPLLEPPLDRLGDRTLRFYSLQQRTDIPLWRFVLNARE